MLERTIANIGLAIVGVMVFSGTAIAAQATGVPDATELLQLAKPVYEAILAGQYWAAAAFALVLTVGLCRWYVVPRVQFFRSDPGGVLLAFLASFGGALGTHLLAVGLTVPTLAMVWAAIGVGFAAIGGYMTAKRLVIPAVEWLAERSPPWLAVILRLVSRTFDAVTGAGAIKRAEAAGAAAVAAKPPTGAAGIVGVPRDVL